MTIRMSIIAIFTFMTLLAGAAVAATGVATDARYVVMFDLTTTSTDESNHQRVFTFDYQKELVESLQAGKALWNDPTDGNALGDRLTAASASTRCVCTKGDVVLVLAYVKADNGQIKFDEKSRKSRLAQDIATLFQIANKIIAIRSAITPALHVVEQKYTLQKTRADLAITAQVGDDKATASSVTIITGPREALYLSADVPLSKASDVELNEAGTTLQLKSKPSTFYAGLNYTFGDIESEPTSVLSHFAVKGMVQASKQPLESYGWAIAVRGIDLPFVGIHLDTITPFAGYTYSRLRDASGKAVGRDSQLRVGVSLNLDAALGWVKEAGK